MFIYIAGVPGVGKSTIIGHMEKEAAKNKIDVKRIVGIPILCELAGVKNTEELRRLPENERRKLRPKMYEIIYEWMRKKPNTLWIFDGHFCYFDWTGKKFGTRPIQSWDKELMLGIVILEGAPETILARRLNDKRPDRKIDINFIKKEIKKEATVGCYQAAILQKPIKFLINRDGGVEETAETILQLIKIWTDGL